LPSRPTGGATSTPSKTNPFVLSAGSSGHNVFSASSQGSVAKPTATPSKTPAMAVPLRTTTAPTFHQLPTMRTQQIK
jgi:hypothetical protein